MEQEIKRIDVMHSLYGRRNGKYCRNCMHLRRHRKGKKIVFKCALYGDTNSHASDWRLSHKACGLYNKEAEIGFVTVMERKKARTLDCRPESLPPIPLEGQLTIFDERNNNRGSS